MPEFSQPIPAGGSWQKLVEQTWKEAEDRLENDFSIEDYPDMRCCVENSVIEKIEAQKIHKVINGLSPEEKMIIYAIYFEDKTQEELASIMGVSQQVVAYRLKKILNKMREISSKNMYSV